MFKNLFKSQSNMEEIQEKERQENISLGLVVEIVQPPKEKAKIKTTNELVEEIHETFYTEVDRLLAEAKILGSEETQMRETLDKAKRLRELGFTSVTISIHAKEEEQRLAVIAHQNEAKILLKQTIEYFSHKYPQYKFITEASVKKICQQYGLIYGEASKYIGEVPDKNLKEIESFKIDENDECYFVRRHSRWIKDPTWVTKGECGIAKDGWVGDERVTKGKCSLEIAANVKDFNIQGMEIKDFKLSDKPVPPDPIVLAPVVYNGIKHYLIVSAWGQEASDELVVNERNN